MKRLVPSSDLAAKQRDELLELLTRAEIVYRESESSFLDGGAILVQESDLPRAIRILRSESVAFGAIARAKSSADWKTQHQGSYWRWLWHRASRDRLRFVLNLLLLATAASFLALYLIPILAP